MENNTQTRIQTRYFWKGTAFPVVQYDDYELYMKNANDMILTGLQMGVSIEEQVNDYKSQLDYMEGLLRKYQFQAHSNSGEEAMKRMCKEMGETDIKIKSIWCLNICALFVLKKIKNDNMYGFLHMKANIEKKEKKVRKGKKGRKIKNKGKGKK